MKFQEQTFDKQRINLDGNEYVGCTLEGCEVVYKGYDYTILRMNGMHNCNWQFIGAAGNTLRFLRQLYHGGGQSLVEQIIAGITAPPHPGEEIEPNQHG